jgi:methionyl-tRNA formyltransferase
MRVVIVGQQAFGKSVLEAFIARGDTIVGVFAAPERPGARPDPLVQAAEEKKLPVYRFAKYSDADALETLRGLNADIGVMAYVLLFAPPEFCAIPKHGMIQFHPSLLPLHRGPAAIPWAIIRGRKETGLTIFRPTPGLDEGPVILQKRVTIGAGHRRFALLRQDLPARGRGAGAGGRPGQRRPRHRMDPGRE